MKKLLTNVSDFVVTQGYMTYPHSDIGEIYEIDECLYGTERNYYILILNMTVNLASLCKSEDIGIEEIDECDLVLQCGNPRVTECDISDLNMQFFGTYYKTGNTYTIPLSIFKTADKFPDTISFYISNEYATTNDYILNCGAEIKQYPYVELDRLPFQSVYKPGEKFDPTGIILKSHYNDHSEIIPTFTFTPDRELTEDDTVITLKCTLEGEEHSVDVEIKVGNYITVSDTVQDKDCFSGVGYAMNSHEVVESGGLMLGYLYDYYAFIHGKLNLASVCRQLEITLGDLNIDKCKLQIICNDHTSVFEITDLDFNSIGSYNLMEKNTDQYCLQIPLRDIIERTGLSDEVDFYIFSGDGNGCTVEFGYENAVVQVGYYGTASDKKPVNDFDTSKSSCEYGNNPKVNLATGRALYEIADLSVGAGKSAIEIRHIYHSGLVKLFDWLGTGAGKGWKLNVQEYLIKGALYTYIYLDGNGYMHTLKQFDWSFPNRFYDNEGLGLTLIDSYTIGGTKYSVMTDKAGNCKAFDAEGRLAMIALAPVDWAKVEAGNANAFIFHYEDNRLARITHQRNEARLEFAYADDLLSEIAVVSSGITKKRMHYNYDDDGNLISIQKSVGSESKTIVRYEYDPCDGMLQTIYDVASTMAVRLRYNKDYKVSQVADGYLAQTDIFDSFVQEGYVKYTYIPLEGNRQVNIENEKQILLTYQLNSRGEVTAAFERVRPNVEEYRTLTLETGNILSFDSSVPTDESCIINGQAVKKVSGEVTFPNSFTPARKGEEKYKNFNVVCYVKLTAYQSKTVKTFIEFKHGSTNQIFGVKLDEGAHNLWQKVCIPISLSESDSTSISNVKFGIYDSTGKPVPFYYDSLKFLAASSTQVKIIGTNLPTDGVPLEQMKTLRVTLANIGTIQIDLYDDVRIGENLCSFEKRDTYLTYYDLLETAKSIYLHGNDGSADLVLNGGIQKKYDYINKASFLDTTLHELVDKDGHCKFVLEQNSPDGSSSTRTYTTFQPNGILTETKITVENKDSSDKIPTKKSSSSLVMTSYDGRLLYKQDAYGVREIYEYDEDEYNLKSVKLARLDDKGNITSEMPLEQYTYDAKKQYVTDAGADYSATKLKYDPPYDKVTSVQQKSYDFTKDNYSLVAAQTEISYDTFGERITKISYKSGTNTALGNSVTYENGRIRTVTDGSSKYGVKYDIPKHEITFTQFNGGIENNIHKRKQSLNKKTFETTFEDKYYRGEGIDTVTAISDKYGRILTISDETQDGTQSVVTYSYSEDFKGSPASYPISKVVDPYSDKTYIYDYNHDGKLCGWYTEGNNFLKVQQISASETKYVFNGNEKYKIAINYDENIVNQPRVKRVRTFYDTDKDRKDNWKEISEVWTSYDYDSLGRVKSKSYTEPLGSAKYNIAYLTNQKRTLPLVSNLEYIHTILTYADAYTQVYDDNYIHTWDYGYDNRGNVNKIAETVTSKRKNAYQFTSNTTYSYDDFNRLTSEVRTGAGDLNREFTYNTSGYGYGKLAKITDKRNSANTITYSYNKLGQMEKYTKGSTEYKYYYDNYGNVKYKTLNGVADVFTWTKGNLLASAQQGGTKTWYTYNHQNVRCKKKNNYGDTTTYFLDGAKILGEDRTDIYGKTKMKLRYFYDLEGVSGFRYGDDDYRYLKDAMGNIAALTRSSGEMVAVYRYGAFGETEVLDREGNPNTDPDFIGNINPFRWKSHYYDVETGFYNINGRYYEIERGCYIDAEEADAILNNALTLLGLDRNGLKCLSVLLLATNIATVATAVALVADPTYDPDRNYTWWDRHFVDVIIAGVQIVAGIILIATGCIGSGIGLIISGAFTLGSAIFGEKIMGAVGLASTGIQTIITGAAVIGCCPPLGIFAFIAGAACLAFATSEMQEGLGFGNWMKDAGMSDGWYTGLMIASNVAATAANISGALYMKNGPKCFKEGTLVLTEDGYKSIEDIQAGDKVLAYDEETGKQGYKEVVRLFRNQTKEWYHINVAGEEIVCTAEHPFFVAGIGFVTSKQLKVFQKLLQSDGKEVIIEAIEIEKLDEAETTYNFEVKDYHTYYVTESNILVHNSCRGKNKLKPDPEAKGAHSTFSKDPITGKINHYATYEPNPLNPYGFDQVLRFDAIGAAHTNPNGIKMPTPHVHEGRWARLPLPFEIPR